MINAWVWLVNFFVNIWSSAIKDLLVKMLYDEFVI